MIRKILLLFLLGFSILWFSVAYFIKASFIAKVKSLNSDNVKITYEDFGIEGFPSIWKLDCKNLHVKVINTLHSHDFKIKHVVLAPNIKFENLNIQFDGGMIYEQNSVLSNSNYTIDFNQDNVSFILNIQSPFYSNHTKQIESLQFSAKSINIYNTSGSLDPIAVMNLDCKFADTKLLISDFSIFIGKDIKVTLDGNLVFGDHQPPIGDINLGLYNYDSLLHKLNRSSFALYGEALQKIISSESQINRGKDVKFRISLNNSSISIKQTTLEVNK